MLYNYQDDFNVSLLVDGSGFKDGMKKPTKSLNTW